MSNVSRTCVVSLFVLVAWLKIEYIFCSGYICYIRDLENIRLGSEDNRYLEEAIVSALQERLSSKTFCLIIQICIYSTPSTCPLAMSLLASSAHSVAFSSGTDLDSYCLLSIPC